MTKNVGNIDRLIRLVAGIALIIAALVSGAPLFANPAIMWGAMIVGVVLVATATMRMCPAYRLFGIRTCKV